MKQFLIKGIQHSIIIIAYLISIYYINQSLIRHNPPILKANKLILGDSHLMVSVNPTQLHNSVNVCQEAEPYVATFYKLKELSKFNKFDTIIVGYSFHNIADYNDQKFANSQWSNEMFNRHYSILTLKDLKGIEVSRESYTKAFIKNMLLFPNLNHHQYIGNFKVYSGKSTKKITKPIEQTYFKGISEIAITYLDSIVSLSKNINSTLILVNTPVQKEYLEEVPIEFRIKLTKLSDSLKKDGVTVLDYSDYKMKDEYFYDNTHLNYEGALIFTNLLVEVFKSNK